LRTGATGRGRSGAECSYKKTRAMVAVDSDQEADMKGAEKAL
jgi:hypothetical protein